MTTLAEQLAHIATGAVYDDLTPELIGARQRAVLATNAYNAAYGRPQAERERLLRDVLGTVGEGANLEPTFRCELGTNIQLGARFFANFDCVMLDGAPITVGDDVLVGPKVGLYTSNHALDLDERVAGACVARPITIGHGVWIAGGATVLPGVSIGDGAVVGAGSVVTRDVAPRTLVVGNPARVVRQTTAADRTGYLPSHRSHA
ncbi:sugar O-acetyltransferase [Cellulomonas sp. DKR-3]|uniref:Acetyltransferase n=1 Tax=Cellulomonas fulva TaxID=2835530 RepID=A0ABS5TXC6_9CELL|nr:sugar O-acetyltransferase [Cellulomonas fulva]MBT0993778.1 sugar O-acetyltransferase [Cellulomonas fulva]